MSTNAVAFAVVFSTSRSLWEISDTVSLDLPKMKGLFESFQVQKNGTSFSIHSLARHYRRFSSSCRTFDFPPLPFSELLCGLQTIKAIIAKKNGSSAAQAFRIRLQITIDPETRYYTFALITKNFSSRFTSEGADLISVVNPRINYLHKYIPASESESSVQSAVAAHKDEALLIKNDGTITESSWGNFFTVLPNEAIITPPQALPGILRELLLELAPYSCRIEAFALDDVKKNSTPAFISNALHGIIAVNSIDGIVLPQSGVISKLAEWYRKEVLSHSERTYL